MYDKQQNYLINEYEWTHQQQNECTAKWDKIYASNITVFFGKTAIVCGTSFGLATETRLSVAEMRIIKY